MWIPVKLVWGIQFSFSSLAARGFFFGAFFDLTCWFHYLMKWFLFLTASWFYGFLLIFSLVFLIAFSVSGHFRAFCSIFVCFYALFNHNQSFLEWFLMFSFSFTAFFFAFLPSILSLGSSPKFLFMTDPHSNCHLWLINLSRFASSAIDLSLSSLYSFFFTIIGVDLKPLSDRISTWDRSWEKSIFNLYQNAIQRVKTRPISLWLLWIDDSISTLLN